MCFTPAISLTTAIIEFTIATLILIRYKNYVVSGFWAIFIYLLGFYQFTEFMLCTSSNTFLWAILGFSATTFLPVIALHFVLRITKINFKKYLIYIIPIIFVILAIFNKNIIAKSGCTKFFVESASIFSGFPPTIYSALYAIYYLGYVFLACFILFKYAKKEDKIDKKIFYIIAISLIVITLVPIILLIILPSIGVIFPSVYCEFAILFSIVALITCEIYDRKKKKEKLIK
jgi:hypothetical protein